MADESRTGRGNLLLAIVSAPAVWVERARGKRRLALIMVYAVIASALGLFAWRNLALRSIPNVRDPFADLPETSAPESPDGKFATYRLALSLYEPTAKNHQSGILFLARLPRWNPAIADQLDPHRESLELWRKASEIDPPSESPGGLESVRSSRTFGRAPELVMMCEFEADRLEGQGDLAGAWRWHRAAVRSSFEIAATSPEMFHVIHARIGNVVLPGVGRWVSDPRVSRLMLESARADLVAIGNRPLIDPAALRAVYRTIIEQLDNRPTPIIESAKQELSRVEDENDWYRGFPPTRWVRWYLLNEPERGKRVTRLIFANSRAYSEAPFASRTAFSAYVVPYFCATGPGMQGGGSGNVILYDDGKLPPVTVAGPVSSIPTAVNPSGPTPIPSVSPMTGRPGAVTSKVAVIRAGLDSSPLLKWVLLDYMHNSSSSWSWMAQRGFPIPVSSAQNNLEQLIGRIDGEIAMRNLPPESRDTDINIIDYSRQAP